MKPFSSLCAVGLLMAACAGPQNSSPDETAHKDRPLVAYCSGIDYTDTAALRNEQVMKGIMGSVVRLMSVSDSATVRSGITVFVEGLRHDEQALSVAAGLAGDYLGSLSSRSRNEEKYIGFLSAMLDVDSLPELQRSMAAEKLRIVSLNRRGSQAGDFRFEEPDGSRRSLYEVEAPATLLIFYNPECGPCKDILKALAADKIVNRAVDMGQLKVLAVYAEGNRKVWRDYLGEMPGNWTVGYDLSGILDNEIYDLPAMPTLYLLDANKRVVLKDPDHRIVGKYIRRAATGA